MLAKDDPLGVVERVRELAILRRKHRSATVPAPDFSTRPDRTFADAVAAFSRWHAAGPGETWTADLIADLERLSAFFEGDHANAGFSRVVAPDPAAAYRHDAAEEASTCCPTTGCALGSKFSARRMDGVADRQAVEHFEKVRAAYRTLIGCIAQSLVHELAAHLTGVIEAYDRRKREAAVLDFDDLLRQARALVCENPDIRAWLAGRYAYLLVDEFQDTDPVQAEIVFCIAAHSQPATWSSASLRPGALFLVGDPKQAIYRFRGADMESYALAKSRHCKGQNGCLLAVTANFRSRPEVIAHVNRVFQDVLGKAGQPGFVPLAPTLDAAAAAFRCGSEANDRRAARRKRRGTARSGSGRCCRAVRAPDRRPENLPSRMGRSDTCAQATLRCLRRHTPISGAMNAPSKRDASRWPPRRVTRCSGARNFRTCSPWFVLLRTRWTLWPSAPSCEVRLSDYRRRPA